jgi:hypothetical protein
MKVRHAQGLFDKCFLSLWRSRTNEGNSMLFCIYVEVVTRCEDRIREKKITFRQHHTIQLKRVARLMAAIVFIYLFRRYN